MSSWGRVGLEISTLARPAKLQRLREPVRPIAVPSRKTGYYQMRNRGDDDAAKIGYLARAGHPVEIEAQRASALSELEEPRQQSRFVEESFRVLDKFASGRSDDEAVMTVLRRARAHVLMSSVLANNAHVPVRAPWIGMSEDGSIGFDWRHGSRELAVTFDRGGSVEFYSRDGVNEEEGQLQDDFDALRRIEWLIAAGA